MTSIKFEAIIINGAQFILINRDKMFAHLQFSGLLVAHILIRIIYLMVQIKKPRLIHLFRSEPLSIVTNIANSLEVNHTERLYNTESGWEREYFEYNLLEALIFKE